MKKRPLAKVGDRIMRGEEQEETIGMPVSLYLSVRNHYSVFTQKGLLHEFILEIKVFQLI